MFPVETLKHLQKLVEETSPARRIVKCEHEPSHVYYVQQPDGEMLRQVALPPCAVHAAADLDSLVRKALESGKCKDIWYSRKEIVARVFSPDCNGFPDLICLNLTPSPQLAQLSEWEEKGKATLTQVEFVIALRTLFAGCVPSDVLSAIRKVHTTRAADLNSQISHGKVSLGKSVVAEMTGVDKIPERMDIAMPVFAEAAVHIVTSVRVEIDPDPENERFHLYVLPNQVEAAYAHAEGVICSRLMSLLRESCVPIYRGVP